MAYNPDKIFTVQMRQDILLRAFFAISNDAYKIENEKKRHQDAVTLANDERLLRETYEAEENFAKALDADKQGKTFVCFTEDEVDQILEVIYLATDLEDIRNESSLYKIFNKIAMAAGKDTM